MRGLLSVRTPTARMGSRMTEPGGTDWTASALCLLTDAGTHFSIWPAARAAPDGWRVVVSGVTRADCLRLAAKAPRETGPDRSNLAGPDVTPAEMFEEWADRTPDATAVECGSVTLSYGALNQAANRLAHHLASCGLGPGDLLAIALPRNENLIIALLAALKAGAAYLPVDPSYPPDRVAVMLADAAPDRVITTKQSKRALPPAANADTILIDAPGVIAALASAPTVNLTDRHRARPLAASDAAYVIYTSGSTGLPKGISMAVSGVSELLQWHRKAMPARASARVAQFTAIGFDFSVQEIFATLATGKTLVVPDDDIRDDIFRFVHWLEAKDINELYGSTAALNAVFSTADEYGIPLPSLADVFQGGEQLQIDPVIRAACQRSRFRLHNIYGPAEAPYATSHSLDGDPANWPSIVPIGQPTSYARVVVLDEKLMPASENSPGELYVSGGMVAHGYWRDPARTTERFIAASHNGQPCLMYRTGDRVRYDEDENLVFLGRLDDQVKIRGYRVEPREVEVMLQALPGVDRAAVVVRGGQGGPMLIAYTVGPAAPEGIRLALSALLPSYMVPADVIRLGQFPLTENGKLDRKALAAMVPTADRAPGPRPAEQLDPRVDALCGIIARYVGGPVSPDDNFIVLGGTSLLAGRIINRVREELGAHLPILALFDAPDIAAIARQLEPLSSAVPGLSPRERS